MKAVVLTYDKNRVLTEHMILKYNEVWPDHPFQFLIPYQDLKGEDSARRKYVQTSAPIKATILELLKDLDDEEMVYWCLDDRYPIELIVPEINQMVVDAETKPELAGLLFCRCRQTLDNPELTLLPETLASSFGETYLERRSWFQIWLHQFLRVKVIRNLFLQFPDEIPFAAIMDEMKFEVSKPDDHRLFVTEKNYAVFGESSSSGVITQNCYDSIIKTDLELPSYFKVTSGVDIIMGKLD